MPRTTLTAQMTAAVAAPVHEYHHLLELQFEDANNNPQPLYITDAAQDIVTTTPAHTWTAVGGAVVLGPAEEGVDFSGHGFQVQMSGVNASPLDYLLTARYRGRIARLYRAHVEEDGTITPTPELLFEGLMNGEWKIAVARSQEVGPPGRMTVSTSFTDPLGKLARIRGHQTNLQSDQAIFPNDRFMSFVAGLKNRLLDWGGGGKTFWGWIQGHKGWGERTL